MQLPWSQFQSANRWAKFALVRFLSLSTIHIGSLSAVPWKRLSPWSRRRRVLTTPSLTTLIRKEKPPLGCTKMTFKSRLHSCSSSKTAILRRRDRGEDIYPLRWRKTFSMSGELSYAFKTRLSKRSRKTSLLSNANSSKGSRPAWTTSCLNGSRRCRRKKREIVLKSSTWWRSKPCKIRRDTCKKKWNAIILEKPSSRKPRSLSRKKSALKRPISWGKKRLVMSIAGATLMNRSKKRRSSRFSVNRLWIISATTTSF